jgi:RHH-type transcriptional regulator, rel operon repressor / antitoxin RelB
MTLQSVTVRLPEEDIAFLEALGKPQDRNRSYLIKEAVEEYIATHKRQIEEIERAIREADAGDFVPEDEMRRLIAKWTA